MWVSTRVFHVPKRGNAEAEYEDAVYPERDLARRLGEFRCAVADGASESAFSGLWAQLLVRSFGKRKMRLQRLQKLFEGAVKTRPVPWYLEKKIKNGAHAAFMGLMIRDGAPNGAADGKSKGKSNGKGARKRTGRSWRALAVGDSCIFHVRDDELLAVGPIEKSELFDNSPFLIASKTAAPLRRSAGHVTLMDGEWEPGDVFYLVTDALAAWLLAEHEAGRPPWESLRDLCADDDRTLYERLVDELRTSHGLHNDDTTLFQVEVD